MLDVWANLGNIDEADGLVHFKAVYVNDNPDTVYVFRTHVSCSCLSVDDFESNYVGPGDKIIANLTYNPAYRNGETEEFANLRLSSRETITVHMTANVKPTVHPIEESHPYKLGQGLQTSHKTLSYAFMDPGETKEMYIHIANGLNRKANIILQPRGEYSDCIKFRQPGKMAADGRDTIHFKMTMPENYSGLDPITFNLQPIVNGVETETPLLVKAFPRNLNKD